MTRQLDLDRDPGAVLARSTTNTVHLAADNVRTECGQRLSNLTVERGALEAVTCRRCRRRIGGAR